MNSDCEEIWSTGCNSCVYYQSCKRLPSDRLGFAHSCFDMGVKQND